ncbi:MAG: polysaccharide pyruvyl transferase family protein [Lachnospiraceae bacterium]|nr:polysaccharide pyruvyl transferase family protein [Lachnospiraceae bacterium]
MKIAIMSLADLNNYGDVFFPIVIKGELIKRLSDCQIDIITNTIYDCGIYKTKAYCDVNMKEYDTIIMGGGELISPYDDEAFCETYGSSYKGCPSDIAYAWLDIKNAFKVWFGVGAHPVLFDYPELVEHALSKLDYLCVRGNISKKVLEKGFVNNNGDIRVMPDLGWLFPEYIDTGDRCSCAEKTEREYCVFQAIQDIDIENNIEFISQTLLDFQKKRNVKVLLLPIMQTNKQWGERDVLEKIWLASRKELDLVPFGLNVIQTGNIISGAKFFVGASLHGAVTSLAYGKPAVNIRSGINTKLQDLHASRFRSTCFANSWEVLPGVLDRLCNESEDATDIKYAAMYTEYMQYRLMKEFDGLAQRIKNYQGE